MTAMVIVDSWYLLMQGYSNVSFNQVFTNTLRKESSPQSPWRFIFLSFSQPGNHAVFLQQVCAGHADMGVGQLKMAVFHQKIVMGIVLFCQDVSAVMINNNLSWLCLLVG